MPICEIVGFRINWGPLKLFPIAGEEIPVKQQETHTQVELSRRQHSSGVTYGELARLLNPNEVNLYFYWGRMVDPLSFRILEGPEINRDPLTKRRLVWVKEQTSRTFDKKYLFG